MSEEFLKEMQELNKLNNKLLNDLDFEIANIVKIIKRLYEPSKKYLDDLISLYNMTIEIYNKKGNTLYSKRKLGEKNE